MVGGQVKVLDAKQWAKLEKYGKSVLHQTIWALLRFTACRCQEARLLTVDNVYSDPGKGIVKDTVFFPKHIRKGKKRSVTVPVTDKLRHYLEKYQNPLEGYLFPSPRNPDKPLSYEAVYKYLKNAVNEAGLGHEKIATHSGRRSLITHLHQSGVSLETIRQITGHMTLQNLQPYIEVDSNQIATAIENVAL